MGLIGPAETDNEALRELRDETKKLRIETAKSSRSMFWLTFYIVILTIILVVSTIVLLFK